MSGDGFKFLWQRAFMASTLPPVARHVLHALGAFMAEDGSRCFPSIDTLATATGLCEKAVRKNLQHAERAGWIRRWERRASGQPLAGRAAQGWRHYQYDPGIPELTTAPAAACATKQSEPPIDRTLTPNVRYDVPHLNPERAVSGSPNVRYDVPTIIQVINQEKTNREKGAIAPVAACAAPTPPVFLQDQEKNKNPEIDERQQEQTASMTEPTTMEQPAAAEPKKTVSKLGESSKTTRKRGTRLAFEELPDDWRDWADGFRDHYCTGDLIDTDRTWRIFRDHFKTTAGKSAVKLDWFATWKNWLRRDIESLNQRPSTRKLMEENRRAVSRREAEQRRWEEDRAKRERQEREAAERKERDERRRIELAPTVARVKAYVVDADHGMTAADVASALDMSEQDLEEVYRAGLARDPDIVCCSPRLTPTGEWISASAKKARDAEKKAREAAQKAATPTQRTRATDAWAWYEDAPEPPQAAPEAVPPAPEPAPAPPQASAPTEAEIEEAFACIEAAGPRGVEINEIAWVSHRALSALCKSGRARMNGARIVATRFDAKDKSAEPKPLGEVLHRFNTSTSTSTTSTVSITGRAVL